MERSLRNSKSIDKNLIVFNKYNVKPMRSRKMFQIQCQLARLLGFAPTDSKSSLVPYISWLISFTILLINIFVLLYLNKFKFLTSVSVTNLIIVCARFINLSGFYYSSINKRNEWLRLISDLSSFNRRISFKKMFLAFLAIFVQSIYMSLELYNYGLSKSNYYHYGNSCIYYIYLFVQLFLISLLIDTVTVLSEKYEDLNRRCSAGVENLDTILLFVERYHNLTESFNAVFGWPICTITVCSVVEIYVNFDYTFNMKRYEDLNFNWMVGVGSFIHLSLYLIFITLLITSCSSVEKTGKKVITTCVKLQRVAFARRPEMAPQLFYLTSFVKELRPTISAAGFFNVQQSILATIFSTLTSYIIICIQFNNLQ